MGMDEERRDSIIFSRIKNELPYPYMVYKQIDRLLDDLSNGKPTEAWFSANALKVLLKPKINEHIDYDKFKGGIMNRISDEIGQPKSSDEEEKARYNYQRTLIMFESVMDIVDRAKMLPEQGILGEEGMADGFTEHELEDTL